MNEQVKNKAATLWKKGQSGNLAGRPPGSRNKFSEDVVAAFAVDWAAGGPEVIARVRQTDPSTYLRWLPRYCGETEGGRQGPRQSIGHHSGICPFLA